MEHRLTHVEEQILLVQKQGEDLDAAVRAIDGRLGSLEGLVRELRRAVQTLLQESEMEPADQGADERAPTD